MEDRLEKGAQAQVDIFGEGMRDAGKTVILTGGWQTTALETIIHVPVLHWLSER